ncbi:peptidoglycan-binding protein [Alkalihalobacillus sp. MEB130]|uniref:C40 family peptidase n=1 Tax=Alkalihalobacillus sp. MEB130 TaxID=2976704 RepID=UPI0028E01534|nr:peptidoglycan-binding protein [Alkalihalobacillus sp. MEB130]MDT8860344.1 peptidoglycan-binding protein [Alkalihalobacillus sp. MEB130]
MKESSTLRKVVISSTFATGLFLATPQMADAALGDQTLRQGMDHPDVKELQDALKKKGFFSFDRSTGFYGTITADAVRDFQRKHNLQVDGIAGPQTLGKLLSEMGGQAPVQTSTPSTSKTTSTTSNLSSVSSLIRFGSNGSQVEQLQQKLKEQGYYKHSITGQFGRVTEAAVRDFQRANNLVVDGIVGPKTLSQLINEPLPAQQTTYQEPKVTEERNQQTSNETVTNAAPTQTTTTLRVGSSGSSVTNLQAQLRSVGVFNQEPTGYYGEITATAVRNFQRVHNLTADGIAGPKTISKLNEVATNKPAQTTTQAPTTTNTTNTTQQVSRSNSNPAALVTNLVAEAANHIGTPYLWGGTTTRGFDCSGFTQFVFNQQGISLPRTVAQQWNAGKSVSQPSVGDMVFFETYQKGPSHNGIYIGNNQFVHSGSSTGVTITSMNNPYWKQRYLGAKRMY